ncbi:Uu.00g061190.m01.CDS01 [Anthostomella pinea]|uniref:Uu.00g061190.m01.CDS01 n=1 Tax=Anthostomella pinea TaxID=933095 RepID=A0AAI8YMJ8_9PEZI|nr:Uu.00g061190.m01.CDS01 [Anthostomella pinea]
MADKQITLVATVWPAEGKMERLKEVVTAATHNLRDVELGTLQFQVLEETNTKSSRMVLIEVYQDQAALDAHRANPDYTAVFKTISEEGLMAKAPEVVETRSVGGYK